MFKIMSHFSEIRLQQKLLLLFCLLCSSGSQADIDLTFGIYTADRPATMVSAYRPILSALERELSEKLDEKVSIRVQVASGYQKGIDAIATGKVDFAMLGPASYVESKNRQPELNILALESKDGSKTFSGHIFVPEESDIRSISELKGKRFAFGNKSSTIGRYLSQAFLFRNGITAGNLKYFDYMGRHDRVVKSVALGRHDAGAVKEGTYRKFISKGYKLRSLATIPLINRPWVASANLDAHLYTALKEAMLSLDAPEAFKTMGRKQFVLADDADFAEIRSAISNNASFYLSDWQSMSIADQ